MSDQMMTLTAIHGKREWDSKFGPMTTYTVEVEGLTGRHELNQKRESAAPTIGMELLAHVEDGGTWPDGSPKPPKIKKAQQQGAGFGGGAKGPRYTPEEIANFEAIGRIKGRCHAQAQALAYANMQATRGKLPDTFKHSDLKPIIDWFVADAESARSAA